MRQTITGTDWLRVLRSDPAPRHQLVCFPPGGGSVNAYQEMAGRLGTGAAVLGVQYPGRQDRIGEPAIPDLEELADRIAVELLRQRPITGLSLFGHSMGATLAFETARRLEGAGQPVGSLFVSGRPAPTFEESGRLHLGSDDDLIAELERLANDPAPIGVLRAEPAVAELVLPALRSDYQAVETYRYRPGDPLSCDLAVLFGTDDPTVDHARATEWEPHTTGAYTVAPFPGGHFYLDERVDGVVAVVATRLGLRPEADR
ncbi:alpha/beta fold hydrolase [Nocardia sp. NPDC050710]|uniref:thioesterase II family protein n=1 Tax=Nocardia sp. NPDC050710 TaxID=3157220 RepID=UPI00341118D3